MAGAAGSVCADEETHSNATKIRPLSLTFILLKPNPRGNKEDSSKREPHRRAAGATEAGAVTQLAGGATAQTEPDLNQEFPTSENKLKAILNDTSRIRIVLYLTEITVVDII